jgi:hypothetical protein
MKQHAGDLPRDFISPSLHQVPILNKFDFTNILDIDYVANQLLMYRRSESLDSGESLREGWTIQTFKGGY